MNNSTLPHDFLYMPLYMILWCTARMPLVLNAIPAKLRRTYTDINKLAQPATTSDKLKQTRHNLVTR
jgi:hypothetical protein